MTTKQQTLFMATDLPMNFNIERPKFQKMLFIVNALEQGWSIKKQKNSYMFSKKHEGKKEFFTENYLETFIRSNNDIQSILDKIK